tara:strand:- start:51 stop:416 length:366 start_codon:yes stop_codon:yes gene_type:complete
MASYTSSEIRNSGSLGEQLNGLKTFIITNFTAANSQYPVGYLTLEGNSTANQNLTSTTFLTGSFSSFTLGGASQDSLVTSSTHWSISIYGDGGQFQFNPTDPIAANSYYIKGTGLFDLEIT